MIALMPTMSSGSDSVGAVVSKKPVIQVSNAGGAGGERKEEERAVEGLNRLGDWEMQVSNGQIGSNGREWDS